MSVVRASLKGLQAPSPIPDVPDAPTIGTATISQTTATVPFTAPTTGGVVTTYTATSTPGGITATSSTSPITVTGLVGGTSYTFKVKGTNATATGIESSASNSVTAIASYALSQTFDSSGTYTVPAGKTQIALVGVSAGGGGGAYAFFDSPSGGSGGIAFIHKDISTNAGTNYTVTIGAGGNSGAGGGALSFGNVFTANGGGGGRSYGITPNTGNITSNAGTTESTAVSAGRQMYQGSVPPNLSVSSSDPNLGTYNASGGGGAGGLGGRWPQPEEELYTAHPPNNTWIAGATGAGNGGTGGTSNGAYGGNMGNAGNAATQRGGGGGSAGHTGYGPQGYNPNPGQSRSGGAGFSGQILVYAR